MKYRIILILQFCLCIFGNLYCQEYDTIYHSKINHTNLEFLLADTNVTAFKVSKINLKREGADTIGNKISVDTFFLQRTLIKSNQLVYDYWYSRKNWINIMLGDKCIAFEDKITKIPVFKLKWVEEDESYIFENCEENIPAIHEALRAFSDCLDPEEDVTIRKFALEDFETYKDCSTQTTKLLYDLGHVTSLHGFPIPSLDTTIYFSIFDNKDTTGIYNAHFYSNRITNPSGSVIRLGVDANKSENSEKKSRLALYNAIKGMLSPEEQKRDSMRMELIEESDMTEIEIDSFGIFKKYKRHTYHAIPNIEMKMK